MLLQWALSHEAEFAAICGSCIILVVAFPSLLTFVLTPGHKTSKTISIKHEKHYNPLYTLQARLKAWAFLIRGPTMIQDAYEKSNGLPFHLDTPDNTMVLVSDWKHIKEINAASSKILSLPGAAKDLLQPKHTMANFNWMDDRGSDGLPLLATLRGNLTNYLPVLLPKIRKDMDEFLAHRFESFTNINSGRQGAIFPIVIEAIAKANAQAFFGPELSRDSRFLEAGKNMIEHTFTIAEILRMVPNMLREPLGKFLSSRLNSSLLMTKSLTEIVSERFRDRELRNMGHDIPIRDDCIQWIMDHSPKHKPWSVLRVVHELIAVWFGSVHITSTTACAAIYDLCDHPEYVDILRQEIQQTGWESFDEAGGQNLPLMDSFLKESARLNPIESISTRRKVLQSFHFSDGTTVHPGQWVCSAPKAMNRNPDTWAHAYEFYGFRFVKPEVMEHAKQYIKDLSLDQSQPQEGERFTIPQEGKASAYTDISDWQQWGTGKASCTGRWYASAAIKTMLGLIISQYDIQLVHPEKERYFAWRTLIYPYESTKVNLLPKQEKNRV